MNRRILIQVTAPAVVIGLLLFGTCLVSAWIVDRLQANMSAILSQNVSSLEAARALEVNVRQLRFHCFRYLVDPVRAALDPSLGEEVDRAHRNFQGALDQARRTASTPEEQECVRRIESGYEHYRREFRRLRAEEAFPRRGYRELEDENPIHLVTDPCERYLEVNRALMNRTRLDSERVSRILRLALLLLGLGGPASGLIVGYGMAHGLSRSIHRLSVRVHDVAHQLEQDVAAVSVVPDGDVGRLDRQLAHVLTRVREVAGRLQEQQRAMIRAQQLAAVGELAASVAHEVRNPLTSIKMLVEAALRERNPRPFTRENLAVVHNEVARLERTVQAFLDFARPPALERSPCDLRALLEEAVALVRARADLQRVELEVVLPDRPVTGEVDRGRLCAVLVNLLLNALDAMPGGGRLEVALGLCPPRGVTLSVSDSGPGIPAAMEGRLFTPFASTRPNGTGLGLCISRRAVEEHGGRLDGENRPGGGARFTITLPDSLCGVAHADAAGDR